MHQHVHCTCNYQLKLTRGHSMPSCSMHGQVLGVLHGHCPIYMIEVSPTAYALTHETTLAHTITVFQRSLLRTSGLTLRVQIRLSGIAYPQDMTVTRRHDVLRQRNRLERSREDRRSWRWRRRKTRKGGHISIQCRCIVHCPDEIVHKINYVILTGWLGL